MKCQVDQQYLETLTNPATSHSPCKMLWAALLERSIRDLFTLSWKDRRDAVLWFKGELDSKGLQFEDVKNALELSDKRIAYINLQVRNADEAYGTDAKRVTAKRCITDSARVTFETPKDGPYVEKKRRPGRKGHSELAKRKWNYLSEEDCSVLRRQARRRVGYSRSTRATELAHRIQRD